MELQGSWFVQIESLNNICSSILPTLNTEGFLDSPVSTLILSLLYSVSFPYRYEEWAQEATAPSCPGIPEIKTGEKKLLKLHPM